MRKVRWFLLLGSALIFGVAVILIYGIGGWLVGSVVTASILKAVLIVSLFLLPYFVTKKILSNSVARRSEAMVLGIFLVIMGHVASTVGYAAAYALDSPPAEWIKKFSAMAGWDEFFLRLLIPVSHFLLAPIIFAVVVAYKGTEPASGETSVQPLAKPAHKKISSWVTILLILAFLLFTPSFELFVPDQGGWEGIVLLAIIPIFLFACGLTLIVQYVMKSAKLALAMAILINALLLYGCIWGIVEPMLDRGPFVSQEAAGKIVSSTEEGYKGIKTGIYFDKYNKNKEGKFVHDDMSGHWSVYPLKFTSEAVAKLAEDYMDSRSLVVATYEIHKKFGAPLKYNTYWLVKEIRQQAGEEIVGIKELTGKFTDYHIGSSITGVGDWDGVDFTDETGGIYELGGFNIMKDNALKQRIIQYAKKGTLVRIQTNLSILPGDKERKRTIWEKGTIYSSSIEKVEELPFSGDANVNTNTSTNTNTGRFIDRW